MSLGHESDRAGGEIALHDLTDLGQGRLDTATGRQEQTETTVARLIIRAGQDEIAEKPGYISVDAPLGRALLGKAQDSEVSIETPGGRREWYVLRVSYQGAR